MANPKFLKNAPLIDKWNKEGLINSKVDDAPRRTPSSKGRPPSGSPARGTSTRSGRPGSSSRSSRCRRSSAASVPFLGVQGFMVTKFAADARRRDAPRRTSSRNYMMRRRPRRHALAAANGRYPANVKAGKRVTDPSLAQFGDASGKGGVPMPNIPQMASVWYDLGGRGSSRRRARARRKARDRPSRPPRATSPTRSASASTAASAAGARRVRAPAVPLTAASTTEPRPQPPPACASGPPAVKSVAACPRLIAAFSGTVGLVAARSLFLGDRQRARGLGRGRAGRPTRSGSRSPCSSLATLAIDVVYLAQRARAAEVPGSRDGLPARVPGHPDPLHDQGRLHELLDRPHPHEGRGDRRDRGARG